MNVRKMSDCVVRYLIDDFKEFYSYTDRWELWAFYYGLALWSLSFSSGKYELAMIIPFTLSVGWILEKRYYP